MDVFRDVLDDQVLDRDNKKMGKVDGLIMDWAPGRQPRITHLEMGPDVWARRVGWTIVRRFASWLSRSGPRAPGAFRVGWTDVLDEGINVELAVKVDRTPAMAWEGWLRTHFVKRIPGG